MAERADRGRAGILGHDPGERAAGDVGLADEAWRLLGDASPLVRGAAVWALAQLLPQNEFNALAHSAADKETDVEVQNEWRTAC